MVATVLLLVLVSVASITDFLRHKIYNWTTYSGTLLAVGLSAAGGQLLAAGRVTEGELRSLGWIPLSDSLFGLAACGSLMLLCFVTFKIGGGDVKLIAMLGAMLGLEKGIMAMLWTFVFGGCVALIVLTWRVGPWRLAVRVFRQIVWTLRLGNWSPLSRVGARGASAADVSGALRAGRGGHRAVWDIGQVVRSLPLRGWQFALRGRGNP